ncbi:hypothetical protein GCM10022232_15450 [Streptomyces plumbiresistens]|uniref:Uncharacterized protein n=1 Tax=Streptomyces plumbiresistens TaxID=511811 RepID=A0ABP7QJW4_9ACTN
MWTAAGPEPMAAPRRPGAAQSTAHSPAPALGPGLLHPGLQHDKFTLHTLVHADETVPEFTSPGPAAGSAAPRDIGLISPSPQSARPSPLPGYEEFIGTPMVDSLWRSEILCEAPDWNSQQGGWVWISKY